MLMNWKQKVLSAGLSAVVLMGAAAPLSAMAASSQDAAGSDQTAQTSGYTVSQTAAQANETQTAAAVALGQPLQTASGTADNKAALTQGKPTGDAEQAENEQENDATEQENDAAEQAQLAAQAKLTEADAIAVAQAAYPGGTVTAFGELDNENGVPVYELKVQPSDGSQAVEVKVDAVTGSILPENADHQD